MRAEHQQKTGQTKHLKYLLCHPPVTKFLNEEAFRTNSPLSLTFSFHDKLPSSRDILQNCGSLGVQWCTHHNNTECLGRVPGGLRRQFIACKK